MDYPDSRVAEVCRLGPIAASDLLEKARGGDLQSLADWTVRAIYLCVRNDGNLPHLAARRHVESLLKIIELRPRMVE